MDSHAFKAKVYITLFIILSLSGTFLAAAAEYMGCPQYACNFIFGMIVTVYIMENWTLAGELNYRDTPIDTDNRNKIPVIKELLVTNAILAYQMEKLKRRLQHTKPIENKISRSQSSQT